MLSFNNRIYYNCVNTHILLGILEYHWQVDLEEELLTVEVTFSKPSVVKESGPFIEDNENNAENERPINGKKNKSV